MDNNILKFDPIFLLYIFKHLYITKEVKRSIVGEKLGSSKIHPKSIGVCPGALISYFGIITIPIIPENAINKPRTIQQIDQFCSIRQAFLLNMKRLQMIKYLPYRTSQYHTLPYLTIPYSTEPYLTSHFLNRNSQRLATSYRKCAQSQIQLIGLEKKMVTVKVRT